MPDLISRQTVQVVTMILALVGSILIGALSVRRPASRMYLVGMALWLCHVGIYYLVVLFTDLSVNTMAWSAMIKLHGVIMAFSTAAGIAHCKRGINA